jgi:hypothetical protein
MRIFKYTLIAMMGLALISCTEDELTGDSGIPMTSPTASFMLETTDGDPISGSSFSLLEQDTTIVIKAMLSETQIVDVFFPINSVGTASLDSDFELSSNSIVIVAGTLTGSAKVTLLADDVTAEEDEVVSLSVGDATTSNVSFDPGSFQITLINTPDFAVNGFVELTFAWGDGGTAPDGEDICDVVDLDFFIVPDTAATLGEDVTGSAFVTGSCPETGDINLPDYTYNVYSSVYADATRDYGDLNFSLPVTITLARYNNDGSLVEMTSWTEDATEAWTTADQEDDIAYIGDIEVSGGMYSFVSAGGDSTDEVTVNLGSLRASKNK